MIIIFLLLVDKMDLGCIKLFQ